MKDLKEADDASSRGLSKARKESGDPREGRGRAGEAETAGDPHTERQCGPQLDPTLQAPVNFPEGPTSSKCHFTAPDPGNPELWQAC